MKFTIIKLIIWALTSMAVVIILYSASDKLTHSRNNFHRYFPPHPIELDTIIDIKYNSYYFSGIDFLDNKVYLGNITAPLHLLEMDLASFETFQRTIKTNLSNTTKFYTNSRISIRSPHFFIMDGVTPKFLKGWLGSWVAHEFIYDGAYFNDAVPLGSQSFAIRSISAGNKELVLGKESNTFPFVELYPELLEKQIDGVFCTDGMLLFNERLSKIIYLYRYRNEYLIIDTSMTLLHKRKTIDTNSVAKIKPIPWDTENSKTMASPPLMVNKDSYSYHNFLFVHSNLMAKNERREKFNESSVLDIYNLKNDTYEFSIYISPYNGFKLKRFMVTDHYLLGIHHNFLVVYGLNPKWFSKMRENIKEPKIDQKKYRDRSRI